MLDNLVKNEQILTILVHTILNKFGTGDFAFVHHAWQMSPHYLVKFSIRFRDQRYIVFP